MKRYLVVFLLSVLSFVGYSQQTVTYDTLIGNSSIGIWPAIVTRHVNHWQMDSVQGIIFSPGAGEDGNNVALLREHGPHRIMIQTGWDGSVVLGNGTHYPVIISLQQPNGSTTNLRFRQHIDIIMNTFKIRRNGKRGVGLADLHLTGISQGGFYSTRFPIYMESLSDSSNAKLINSMWIIQGVEAKFTTWGSQPHAWPRMFGWWAKNFRGRLLYQWNTNDVARSNQEYIKSMNDSISGSAVQLKTSFGGSGTVGCGHCMFDETYKTDQTWTIDHPEVDEIHWFNTANVETTPATSLNMNWAQWLLRNGDTTLSGGNALPVVSINSISPITLPTNSVNIVGSATDADGTISSYLWEKVSGPAGGTFGSGTAASTTFSGLTNGTYVVRLTATDNSGGTGNNTVNIVVNPTPSNEPPVVDAGGDKSITLPTNSITLTGSATDADGSIASYLWTQISGGSATIVSPTSASTLISGLSQGTYVFQLAATDDDGSTSQSPATVN